MLTYEPGETVLHHLDARAKLVVQVGFAATAFAHPTPGWLLGLSALTLWIVLLARLPLVRTLWDLRLLVVLLVAGPILEGLRLGSPWFAADAAVEPALASYRVGLILLVSAAYVRTTPIRETRAAIQRHVPGRVGRVLGVGVGLVVRFLPVLQRDLRQVREAMQARLGGERPLRERMQIVATSGLRRTFTRADRLALAMRARCFAWNPTLPALAFGPRDYPVFGIGLLLGASALL